MLVGTDAELAGALDARGFVVESETPETAAARFGEFAAPALAVMAAADGDCLYVGGYTDRKQGLAVQDLATIEACRSGARPNPLPVYGCGATNELETALDPLRLRR